MPTVINRHHYKHGLPEPWKYIGRGTPLGNPFTRKEFGDQAIPMYRRWLWRQIQNKNKEIISELSSIQEDTYLVCSCKPKPCHGDIVLNAYYWIWSR